MARAVFDQKFGKGFLKTVPLDPGVYVFLDTAGTPIYVGKAIRLRRRLSQYRNAKRLKRHKKMRAILAAADRVQIEVCDSHLSAVLLENILIQKLRPKFNIEGAFSYMYPKIGLRYESGAKTLDLIYTTNPNDHTISPLFWFGAFRSRYFTKNAYFALLDLLPYLAHESTRTKREKLATPKYSIHRTYRQFSSELYSKLVLFFSGRSPDFLETLALGLLESNSARRRASEVEEHLKKLRLFFKFEARLLRRALDRVGKSQANHVSQKERDQLFLLLRFGHSDSASK